MVHNLGRTTTITREATVETPLHLEVRNANGRVQVRGVPGNSASVRATVHLHGFGRDDDDNVAERVAEGIVFERNSLTIESPGGGFRGGWHRGVEISYEVSVPMATIAELSLSNSPVDVRGIEGPLEVTLANGPVTIEDVSGAIEVTVANGPVKVSRCGGPVHAQVTNGPLRIDRTAGPLEAKVTNGPVDLEEIGGNIQAEVNNGPITYRGPIEGNFDMRADHGGIDLRLPGDSRFELDAEAERGNVYCDFDVNEDRSAPSDAPAHRLHLRTQRGEIRLMKLGSGFRVNASVHVGSFD